jgi:hypothetical protein
MKAWEYDVDEGVMFVLAKDRNQAKHRIEIESDGWVMYADARPRRCPEMDGLAISSANLLRTGAVSSVWCAGDCDMLVSLYPYREAGQVFLEGGCVEVEDSEYPRSLYHGDGGPVIDWRGNVWCCEQCRIGVKREEAAA